jgi:hypothetical protein
MKPMEDLSRKRIFEVREELKSGKREGQGYPDLLTLMGESAASDSSSHHSSRRS